MFNNQEFKNLMNSMNEEETNKEVVPVEEVKVEEIEKIEEQQQTFVEQIEEPVQNYSNSEPIESSKTSTVLVILLFIFLFAFVMLMPNINDWITEYQNNKKSQTPTSETVDKKPVPTESTKPTPIPATVILNKLTCTSNTEVNENYTLTEVQIFSYNTTKQVLSSSLQSQYKFTAIDDTYNDLQQKCSDNSLKYVANEGYTFSCNYDGKNINIGHEFDLKTFTPIMDDTTSITANATYKQNVEEIKISLLAKGYTCE